MSSRSRASRVRVSARAASPSSLGAQQRTDKQHVQREYAQQSKPDPAMAKRDQQHAGPRHRHYREQIQTADRRGTKPDLGHTAAKSLAGARLLTARSELSAESLALIVGLGIGISHVTTEVRRPPAADRLAMRGPVVSRIPAALAWAWHAITVW